MIHESLRLIIGQKVSKIFKKRHHCKKKRTFIWQIFHSRDLAKALENLGANYVNSGDHWEGS